jgi:hypothetical protein
VIVHLEERYRAVDSGKNPLEYFKRKVEAAMVDKTR